MNIYRSEHTIYNLSIITSLTIIIAGCLAVYWPGLNGIFLVDDYPNLKALGTNGGVTNFETFIEFVFGNRSGPTGRPVSMLSFLLNDQHWPSSAFSFKYTNLMIHLLCGMLIFVLCNKISSEFTSKKNIIAYISFIVMALWLFHPLNVSTTLYVIQRMAQLATLFSLVGILCYLYGRTLILKDVKKGIFLLSVGVTISGLLAVLSKENGVLLVLYILVIEFTLFSNHDRPKELKYWFWIFIYAPLAILFIYFASRGFLIENYSSRDFTLYERLLTENRILLDYLHSILIPHLYGTGLTHDDYIISTGLLSPVSTLLSLIINLALISSAIYYRKKQPVFSFSVLWFYGGHILESSFISLELYFEHRNYMPMIGPLFGLVFYVSAIIKLKLSRFIQYAVISLPVIMLLLSSALTYKSSIIWSHPGTLFRIWAEEHPDSLRAQRIYGQYLGINNSPEEAIKVLEKTYQKFPYDISLPIAIINVSCRYDKNPRYSVDDLINISTQAEFTDGILPVTRVFIDNAVKNKCGDIYLKDAISVLENIVKVKGIDRQKTTLSQLLFLLSDLYVINRQLGPAIKTLDEVFHYQKTTSIPVRQVELLISAGLYKDALRYLNIAKSTDEKRETYTSSQREYLKKLEHQITAKLNNSDV